ncbi:MAG: flagellar hook protein, partial [Pseudobutyrivibrio sp.]|nr:flagellar hook protein [Pseudobutyrivibrio sp.]MCR5195020.1 flagellar hook protein [Pseudobutyrivibrio sp.]
DNVVENTEAAESRIRDTDMADTMVEYSKNNILQQAGQSMLAQANQATQGVMNLLQ